MSNFTERVMRNQYVSKAECLEHWAEAERLSGSYGRAMAAMKAWERKMEHCTCEWDGDALDDGTPVAYRTLKAGCPVHDLYVVDAKDGGTLAYDVPAAVARQTAQEIADLRHEPVYLYQGNEDGDEGEVVEVSPRQG